MRKIIIINIKTSGFLNFGGKIVEIGIVELNLESGNIEVVYNKITHEKGITKDELIDSWIINNSDLSVKKIINSVRLDYLKHEIQEIINNYPLGVTAYNLTFTIDFLESRNFIFPKKLNCPMILSTDILKLPLKSTYYKKKRIKKYRYPTVQEAYCYFFKERNYIEKNRAVDSALHEAKIVYELFKLGIFKV